MADIDFDKADEFLQFMIVEAASAEADKQKKDITEVFPDIGKKCDVVFTLNGVNMPLEPVFKHMYKQFDDLIASKAKELIEDKLFEHNEFLKKIGNTIKRDMLKKLNLEVDEW